MLRRTLQCLLGREGPSTLKRAVMAKARSNTGNSSEKAWENVVYRDGFSGGGNRHVNPPEIKAAAAAAAAAGEGDGVGIATPALAASSRLPHIADADAQQELKEPQNDASSDAYRFLLHHIDSEIAALKRRVTAVGKQRESVENTQNRRIRELFECIERPWLLLESIPAPQLPNKAMDVFAKEQYVKYRGSKAANFEEDAVFLDACRRNWRGLSVVQRKPYEIAARRNEQLRKELKKKVANGCTHFESFCEQAKEWTAEMARKELKGASASNRRTTTHGRSLPAHEPIDAARAPRAAAAAATTMMTTTTVASKKAPPEARLASAPAASGASQAAVKNPARRRHSNGRKEAPHKAAPPVRARASAPTPVRQRQQKPKLNRAHGVKSAHFVSPVKRRRK